MNHQVDDCAHRRPLASKHDGASKHDDRSARCELINRQLDGLCDEPPVVTFAACTACCRTFAPTDDDWNSVIASHIFQAVESQLPSVPAPCDRRTRLEALQQRAIENIPLVLPHEDDLTPRTVLPDHTIDDRANAPSLAQMQQRLPPPASRHGQVHEWAVGVTTAPRRQPTLTETLTSMISAGFTSPHLFIDGDVDLPAEFVALPRTHRRPAIGAWPHYFASLAELLVQSPTADALMLVQDDTLWPIGWPVREYLESTLWPGDERTGDERSIVSLYCCADDTAASPGWEPLPRLWKYGALAFVFPRQLAIEFLASPRATQHAIKADGYGLVAIDLVIGEWAQSAGVSIDRPTPSIVQHIGHVSTIWPTSRAVGLRIASHWLGNPPE